MKIIITGAYGFMGKNMLPFLLKDGHDVFCVDRDTDISDLKNNLTDCDFIIHLAGVMRPKKASEFYEVGDTLTKCILDELSKRNTMPTLIYASSTQALLDNDYGKSKKACENVLIDFSKKHNMLLFIYRFTNAFGKWGRPNYNSVLSTFCYNISHSLPIFVRDPKFIVNFIYIDDIVDSIRHLILGENKKNCSFLDVNPVFPCSLGRLSDLINGYYTLLTRQHIVPRLNTEFEKDLFTTFITYFDLDKLFFNSLISPFVNFKKTNSFLVNERKIQIIETKKELSFSLINRNSKDEFSWKHTKGFILVPPGFEFIVSDNELVNCEFYSL